MKSLIVNADDFGLSPGINRGIIETFENGIVTRTSIMANGPAFDDACSLALQTSIPVGLHLNLTFGLPVLSPEEIPSLVDARGRFYGKWAFTRRFFSGLMKHREIEKEFHAQLEKVSRHSIHITHLDSHHHIHCLPGVGKICRQLAGKYGIKNIRRVTMPRISGRRFLSSYLSQMIIASSCKFRISKFEMRNYTCWGFEFMAAKNKKDTLLKILASLQEGVNELMCHPGYAKQTDDVGKYLQDRQAELKALCEHQVREFVMKNDIKLISFGQREQYLY